jgi:hypothetical protein
LYDVAQRCLVDVGGSMFQFIQVRKKFIYSPAASSWVYSPLTVFRIGLTFSRHIPLFLGHKMSLTLKTLRGQQTLEFAVGL